MEFTVCVLLAGVLALCAVEGVAQDFSPEGDATCLTACFDETVTPCMPSYLPRVVSCLNESCPNQMETARGTSMKIVPYPLFSCQQDLPPGSPGTEAAPSFNLTGSGKCTTSPVAFRSFFAAGGTDAGGNNINLVDIKAQCTVRVFDQNDCAGSGTALELSNIWTDQCVFEGGKSVRLECGVVQSAFASYSALLDTECPLNATRSNSTTTWTYSGASIPSNGFYATSTWSNPLTPTRPLRASIPTESSTPESQANAEEVAGSSLVALVAVFALAIALV